MGRGNSKSLDWGFLDMSLDMILSELTVDEIWVEDLYTLVIDKYVELSKHKVIRKNHYPRNRFRSALSQSRLLSRGWDCKQRVKTSFLKIEGEKIMVRKTPYKAFRVGETND